MLMSFILSCREFHVVGPPYRWYRGIPIHLVELIGKSPLPLLYGLSSELFDPFSLSLLTWRCVGAVAAAEVYFYDAVENVEDLCSVSNGDDEDTRRRRSADPRMSRLQSRLVTICQRKANVRNRKVLETTLWSLLSFFVQLVNLVQLVLWSKWSITVCN